MSYFTNEIPHLFSAYTFIISPCMISLFRIFLFACRFGPIFKVAPTYTGGREDRLEWMAMSDMKRIETLISGKYKALAIDLSVLFLFSSFLIIGRILSMINAI